MIDTPDSLTRFVLEDSGVRGELVRLDSAWQHLRARHEYPPAVAQLLGEAAVAGALLASTIKINDRGEGALIMQMRGDGPVKLVVVEATGNRTLRGLAQWHEARIAELALEVSPPTDEPIGDGAGSSSPVRSLLGKGHAVMTIDPGAGKERYQGIAPLAEGGLAATIGEYFERSEQLPTRLWLAADDERASGLLLQMLPQVNVDREAQTPAEREETWRRACMLSDTLVSDELLGLAPNEVLRRLFHEEQVRVFDPEAWRFHCGCSATRVSTMLQGLGEAEVRDIIEERGSVDVTCEFCNASYSFDAVDALALFADGVAHEARATRH